jgi:hypothetical protein
MNDVAQRVAQICTPKVQTAIEVRAKKLHFCHSYSV